MIVVLTRGIDGYAQFIAVLIVFVFVLGLTYFTTKWIAKYQKVQSTTNNIDVIETTRISNSKYIQIVRIGDTYMAIAVCKDTVTALCEVPKEQLKECQETKNQFHELLSKTLKRNSGKFQETKDE